MSIEDLRVKGAATILEVLERNTGCGIEDHEPRCLESNAFDAIDALLAQGWRIHTGEKA